MAIYAEKLLNCPMGGGGGGASKSFYILLVLHLDMSNVTRNLKA